jgi:toxin ParE1/3/4
VSTSRCSFADPAEADLEAIGDYIALDNPRRAESFVAELRVRCLGLADYPRRFRLRPEYGPGVRGTPHGRYLILYSERAGHVVIERIIHGARDPRPIED